MHYLPDKGTGVLPVGKSKQGLILYDAGSIHYFEIKSRPGITGCYAVSQAFRRVQ